MTSSPDHYKSILLFLGTAAVVAPLFRRLKVSPIFGFLVAGFCFGPYGLGALVTSGAAPAWLSRITLDNLDEITPLADFGVAFLLFMIGLELSFERLLHLRRLVFGFGAAQVFSSALVLGGLALALHHSPASALILGLALAMSSTAIVIPVLADRKRLGTTTGRTIFSVLLFQDLMVAPLLFLVTILGAHHDRFDAVLLYTVLPACLGIGAVALIGRLVLRPLFHLVAAAGLPESFMAACLFVVIGTSVVSAVSGLSMGLGALIAGLLLAETEYRRQIEVTIEPFQGLLLGLFFLSVGAGLDLSLIFSSPLRTLGLAAGFIAIKAIATYAAGRLFRFSPAVTLETALMLAPGGEFALVVIASAIASRALGAQIGGDALVAVTLSMFVVPLMGILVSRLPRPKAETDAELAQLPSPQEEGAASKAIIVGYGRVGQLVGEMLKAHAIDFIAIETGATLVKQLRQQGLEIYWGDASRPEFLARCGIANARALIVTVGGSQASEEIVAAARPLNADLTIVARARDAEHARTLYELGVTDAVPETVEASLQLSEAALVDLGIPMGLVIASIHAKRDEYRKALQLADGKARREFRAPRHRR
ncbi:potassium transporter TrkA [Methylovirgula ligni]|uniref:Kef-type potassium/proton antiporter (CPA2 family) n=1 Tax=Methylovirgula ligni TaxID=569860 RepID=A0A3D9YW14_9HYPH|nr:cation:proton antiporter [Methylovirgula ligni]QAY95939.1 potassium transporter TrkA [Methylovirgula ligni]REF86398.1 Kef-type potassium/proton antiporter (CPA2 family) [Methylovirgula ligni]